VELVAGTVQLTENSGNESSGISVQVSRAAGEKCERCWNYSTRVGEDTDYPTVCERCSPALHRIEALQGSAQ
jgi:isoleucyl-tRNA synthetase